MIYPEISTSTDPAVNPQAGIEVTESDKLKMGVPTTVSVVQVISSLKGNHKPGDSISISQLGGLIDNVDYIEIHTMLLGDIYQNDDLLLFVNEHQGHGADLVSAQDGVISASGNNLLPAQDRRGHRGGALANNLGSVKKSVQETSGR